MKRLFAILAIVLLAACGTTTEQMKVVYKEGSTRAERERVLNECEFESVKTIPRAMAVEMSGGYSSPGSLQCTTFGGLTNCNRVGAIDIPASGRSYDANTPTRLRYMDSCLERKGYSILQRPVCKTDAEKAAMLAADERQLPAPQISCGIPSRVLN